MFEYKFTTELKSNRHALSTNHYTQIQLNLKGFILSRFQSIYLPNYYFQLLKMQEVLSDNFKKLLPEILQVVKQAKFIAIDTEFPALHLNEANKPSLFDTPEARYTKVRNTAMHTIPIQIGLSAFLFEANANVYRAHTYTFYIWPKALLSINQNMQFQATSFQFFSRFNIDYNKLIYQGLPFLNSEQEQQLNVEILANECNLELSIEDYAEEVKNTVSKWFMSAEDNGTYIVESSKERLKGDIEALFQIQCFLRKSFDNKLNTEINENNELVLTKCLTSQADLSSLRKETIDAMLGFTHVYRALVKAKKPIVGHNMFLDILLLQNTFGTPLPKSYKSFKQLMHSEFPYLVDTKTLSFIIRKSEPKSVTMWTRNSLEHVYKYFKDDKGRKLSFNSPYILNMAHLKTNEFHNAGFDSYCTGYIFIRMAHYLVTKKLGDDVGRSRDIMSSEHLAAVQPYMNQINLIRSTVSHLNIDGKDPTSTRPPMLVAVSPRKDLEFVQLAKLLSKYGDPEIQPITRNRAMIAVNSWNNARSILKEIVGQQDFTIKEYNFLMHNKYAEGFLGLSIGILIIGTITMLTKIYKHI